MAGHGNTLCTKSLCYLVIVLEICWLYQNIVAYVNTFFLSEYLLWQSILKSKLQTCLVFFVCVFFSLPLSLQYGIVLDAGSSHTALYTYRWPADKLNGTGVVAQHSECHVKGQRASEILKFYKFTGRFNGEGICHTDKHLNQTQKHILY